MPAGCGDTIHQSKARLNAHHPDACLQAGVLSDSEGVLQKRTRVMNAWGEIGHATVHIVDLYWSFFDALQLSVMTWLPRIGGSALNFTIKKPKENAPARHMPS